MRRSPPYLEISPEEVRARLEQGQPLRLVDVRQPWEYENAHIPGALLLPLGELPMRFQAELEPSETLVCLCEHGVRSRQAAQFLAAQGFQNVSTMTGGMAEYYGPIESAASESLS